MRTITGPELHKIEPESAKAKNVRKRQLLLKDLVWKRDTYSRIQQKIIKKFSFTRRKHDFEDLIKYNHFGERLFDFRDLLKIKGK